MTKVTLLDLYESLSDEEKKEFISLIIDELKKVEKTTFLEQYHNSLKAITAKNTILVAHFNVRKCNRFNSYKMALFNSYK